MARPILRKGRMLPEDEERIQRCTDFIEKEVEARDLTSSLYSSKVLDYNDRSEIDAGDTRVGRVRRLLEILIMRGPYAYHEFIKALKKEGYGHVVGELQEESEVVDGNRNDSDETTDDRLSRIEDLLKQLCQRVTHLESKHEIPDVSDDDITDLKEQLSGLKEDTVNQMKDLIRENTQKEAKIAVLTAQLEEKQRQLQKAEERILELENRIQELESHCSRYRKDIDHLKKQGGVQADRLQRQERRIQAQSDQMQKQQRKFGEQEKKLVKQHEDILEMKKDNDTRMGDMAFHMTQMASVLETVQSNMANDGRIRVIGRNVPQQTRHRSKTKWK